MGKEPLQPLCEEDSEVTVQKLLGSRWAKSQSSESLSLKRPRVGPQSILVKPSLAMKDFTIQEPQPQSLQIPTIIPSWLFLRETIWIPETIHDSDEITDPTIPPPTPSSWCDHGATPSTHGTPDSCHTHRMPDTRGTSDICGTGGIRHTSSIRDISGIQDISDSRDKRDTHDTSGTRDTRDSSGSRDTSSSHDISGTHDTRGTSDTCDTSSTHDTHGKSSTHCKSGTRDITGTHDTQDTSSTSDKSGIQTPAAPVAPKTPTVPVTLAAKPQREPTTPECGQHRQTLLPSRAVHSPAPSFVLSRKKRGMAGRIWRFIILHCCCGLPSKTRTSKVGLETTHG
ncbi:hypothetical protein MG293_014693 [Ovis ammon polii]|uniref:Uncharacterized protein n=2 Tax=Ovis TaxID=9935 RepID=A0AAD4Y5S6_OVIAM|nr:hypothetical protein MG293_014693 [Ovis ammon polii]